MGPGESCRPATRTRHPRLRTAGTARVGGAPQTARGAGWHWADAAAWGRGRRRPVASPVPDSRRRRTRRTARRAPVRLRGRRNRGRCVHCSVTAARRRSSARSIGSVTPAAAPVTVAAAPVAAPGPPGSAAAVLSAAVLSGAVRSGAVLSGAVLSGAVLSGPVLSAALSGPMLSTNRPALRILMASRRPTLIWARSNAVSTPSRALNDQYRTASAPCSRSRSMGVTALPLDLDIFLRSGSRIQPEIAACCHGNTPISVCARSTV